MSRTRIHVAVGLSVLTHGMLVAIPLSHKPRGDAGLSADPMPLTVRLIEAPQPSPEILPTPVPAPEPVIPVRKPIPAPVRSVARPQPVVPEPPVPVETVERARAPQFDMLAMINARRERRHEMEEALVRRSEEARTSTDVEDAALASIKRNLQSLGTQGESTGGVFTILSKGTRTAEFAFNGWRPESNRRWREVIEVDAGPGGDVELAIVRRMIQLIRGHYSGDFIWRSHRLGKSIVLSARLEDSHDLEEFLVREFFGTPTLAHGH